MPGKTEMAIVGLVLIVIILSSATMYYATTAINNISTLSNQVTSLQNALNTKFASLETTLVVGTTDSVELTLDPAQAYDYFGWNIMQQVGGTLVAVNPGSATGTDFVGDLATSWNSSIDTTVWDFTLRTGIKLANGVELNATHVKYSFDRSIALIPNIPDGAPANLGYGDIINYTEVLDTYRVRFVLKSAFSAFLGIMACRASAIVDPAYAPWMTQVNYTASDARASTPLAFVGPYVLSEWNRVGGKDQEIKLDANPDYWNAPAGYPKTKHIIFKFYSDETGLRLAISAGDVDMAYRSITANDVLDLQTNPNVKVWQGGGAFVQYLCFQTIRPPFNDPRVRMAVVAALNRTAITQTVFLGLAKPLYSIIPPGMLGHSEAFQSLGDANYTLTTSLLAQMGYSQSAPLQFDLWYPTGHYQQADAQALVIQQALEASKVIKVTLKTADWPSYKTYRDSKSMDAFIYGWYPDYMDPDDYAFLYWAPWLQTSYNATTAPVAYKAQLGNYTEARSTTNSTLRVQLYGAIDNIAVQQCSVAPLFSMRAWAVTKPSVYGVYLDITEDMRYWLISK
jgi:peptide/nickel transport system substrate-binding protein